MRSIVGRIPDWEQRIVADATNAIDYRDFSPADLGEQASSDLVEQWAHNARVEEFGFAPIDLGRNDQGGLLQQFGGPLTTRSFISQPFTGVLSNGLHRGSRVDHRADTGDARRR